ncbi:MAG: hypothetical protein EHM35_03340 [Planctomycetaceae bacterium]|nr:MAG: hypothetical protein EHM35_03340 [Planctomycetaceae bacterium]
MPLQKAVHDIATGEVVLRDMTPEEEAPILALWAKITDDARAEATKAAADAIARARAQAKLDELGIGTEDLKLLVR